MGHGWFPRQSATVPRLEAPKQQLSYQWKKTLTLSKIPNVLEDVRQEKTETEYTFLIVSHNVVHALLISRPEEGALSPELVCSCQSLSMVSIQNGFSVWSPVGTLHAGST